MTSTVAEPVFGNEPLPVMLPDCSFVEAVTSLIEFSRYYDPKDLVFKNIVKLDCTWGWPYAVIEGMGKYNNYVQQAYRPREEDVLSRYRSFLTCRRHPIHIDAPLFRQSTIQRDILSCFAQFLGELFGDLVPIHQLEICE